MPAPGFARFASIVAAALVGAVGLSLAGTLAPPAGPVVATMKPLTDVEPRIAINAANTPGDSFYVYKITQPGSYTLTGNISGAVVAGKGGIQIAANDVTVDLNGFTLTGSHTNARAGIAVAGTTANVVIRNGTITNFAGDGVSVAGQSRVEDVRITLCGDNGVEGGADCAAVGCLVASCTNVGIKLWGNGTVAERCTVSGCETGFNGPDRIVHCTARANTGTGFLVYVAAEGCHAEANGGFGFQTLKGSVVVDCTAGANTGAGFDIGNGGRATGCNSNANSTDGFDVHAASTIERCSAIDNAVNAVRVRGFYGRVIECTLSGMDGFPVIGIDTNMPGALIERNWMTSGTYAVAGTTAFNALVVGNQCVSQSIGFTSVNLANNQVGPIVTATGTIASTSPHANFVR